MPFSILSTFSRFFNRQDDDDATMENIQEPVDETPDFEVLYKQKDSQARKYERLYKRKSNECQDHLERISLFEKQVDECVVNLNSNAFSQALLTDKNIDEFLEVHRLLKTNNCSKVENSFRLLKAIKTLFVGITYGVIPIVVNQSTRLSQKQRKIIKLLDAKGKSDIKNVFNKYTSEIIAIFRIFEETLVFLKKLSGDLPLKRG
jgi:hypothetical protein